MGHVALRLNVHGNIRSPLAVTISDHLMHNPLASVSQKCEIFFHHFLIIYLLLNEGCHHFSKSCHYCRRL